MAQPEIDSFVTKFKYLWNSGLDATLRVETNDGKAWVTLQAGLGQLPPPPYFPPPYHLPAYHRNGPARQRRCERRAAERKANAEETHPAEEAGETEEVQTEDTNDLEIDTENFSCELCESIFKSLKGLRAHIGRKHKASDSPIPQVDGVTLDNELTWNFSSEFADDDVEYTIKEMFPQSEEVEIVSKLKLKDETLSAERFFKVRIKLPPEAKFSWPVMTKTQLEVLKNLRMEPA